MADSTLFEFLSKSVEPLDWSPTVIGIFSLIAIIGNRHIIDEVWNKAGHIMDHPIIKVVILFCMMIWLLKNLRLSLLFCLLYIWFISSLPEMKKITDENIINTELEHHRDHQQTGSKN